MRGTDVLGQLGVGIFAVACCGALPLVAGVLGGLTLTAVLGGGLLFALCAGAATVVAMRFRRRVRPDRREVRR